VAEAKGEDLVSHIPQVMAEMQACAKCSKSRRIRGTITINGRAWIFLLLELELNDSFVDGRYCACQRYEIKTHYTTDFVIEHSVDMIVAILAHWALSLNLLGCGILHADD